MNEIALRMDLKRVKALRLLADYRLAASTFCMVARMLEGEARQEGKNLEDFFQRQIDNWLEQLKIASDFQQSR